MNKNIDKLGTIMNIGNPSKLANFETIGFAAEACQGGNKINVITRWSGTSDEAKFHVFAKSIAQVLNYHLSKIGEHKNISGIETLLLVIKPDKSAELWLDNAAVELKCIPKTNINAGTVVFEQDIVDVTGMRFPCVDITEKDGVIVLFRQDWRFGLYFDFRHDDTFSLNMMSNELGALYRNLRYRHIYDLLSDGTEFKKLTDLGWFPFAEIINSDFLDLAKYCEANFDIGKIEKDLLNSFDNKRLDHILKRWLAKPHMKEKEIILKSAMNNFKRKDYVATIKTISTEIEGVLRSRYPAQSGTSQNLKSLTRDAFETASQKAGSDNSLLLPKAFEHYLSKHFNVNFDPSGELGNAGSRHAVSHGRADPESYTGTRALQLLLILDQFAFYT